MKKFIITILKTIWAIIGFVAIYIILALAIPYIEVPAKPSSEPKTVTAYILTNGVHTDLVVPVKNVAIDWSTKVPYGNTKSKEENLKYLGIGWGDKGFYLDTPTWAELKVSTAFKAAFWLGESAMHCTYYEKMTEGEDCKKLELTQTEYLELVNFIEKKFEYDQNGKTKLIKTDAVYGKNDAFYDAIGSYSFLYTCNTWTNDGLKEAGQKAAFWTPTDFGIFQHYK